MQISELMTQTVESIEPEATLLDKPAQKLPTSGDHAGDATSVKPSRAAFLRMAAISRAWARWVYSSGLRSQNGVRWVSR
jgi:hypothetical protein